MLAMLSDDPGRMHTARSKMSSVPVLAHRQAAHHIAGTTTLLGINRSAAQVGRWRRGCVGSRGR
jgi:hypothetical protein